MRVRVLARAAVALSLTSLCGPPVLRHVADVAVESRIRAVLAATPGLTVGEVRSRSDLGRVEVQGLSAAGPGWRVNVGSLSVEATSPLVPGLIRPAQARSSVTRAKDVVVSLGDDLATVTIPEIVALGTDLSADDLAAYASPADIGAFKAMLAKLTAASLSAPEVRIAWSGGGRPVLVIKNLALTDVSAGRIGSLAADGSAVAAVVNPGDPPVLTTGTLGISALDLPLILEVATGSRTDADAQLAPLFRSLTLGNFAVADRDRQHWTMGRLSLGALRARPLLVPPADVGGLLRPSGFGLSPPEKQVLSDVVTDAARSVVLDHAELDDMSLSSPADGLTSFKLGRIALDGVEPLRLGSVAADAMVVEANATEVTLGHLVLGDYDATGFLDVLKQQALGLASTATEGGAVLPPRSSIALADLGIRLPSPPKPGNGGGMPPLQPSDQRIQVPTLSIDGGADAASGTISSRVQAQLVYDFGDDPNFAEVARYGVKRLDMTAGFGVTLDPKAKTLVLDRTVLDLTDLGALSVVARFANVDPGVLRAGPDQTATALLGAGQNAVFQSVVVGFANAGLMEKIIPPLAAASKVSVPLFKAQLKAQTDLSLTEALGPGPVTQRLIAAVRTFIDTPKSIVVGVTAPDGLPLGSAATAVGDPKGLMSQVTVEVAANR